MFIISILFHLLLIIFKKKKKALAIVSSHLSIREHESFCRQGVSSCSYSVLCKGPRKAPWSQGREFYCVPIELKVPYPWLGGTSKVNRNIYLFTSTEGFYPRRRLSHFREHALVFLWSQPSSRPHSEVVIPIGAVLHTCFLWQQQCASKCQDAHLPRDHHFQEPCLSK